MSIRIVCESHRKPHVVMDWEWIESTFAGAGWAEVPASSADERRAANGSIGVVRRGVARAEHIVELRGNDVVVGEDLRAADVPRYMKRDAISRSPSSGIRAVFAVKCDRCQNGRDRRAERLYPVLDALRDAGRTEVTVREFWAVADAMDSPRRR